MRHVEDHSPIPSVPYTFPNGQGDVEKFINGQKNSVVWEDKHGPIYRIWSGMTPEMYDRLQPYF